MMPFMTQPAVAPACYVPRERQSQSQAFRGAQILTRTPTVAGHSDKWTWRAMVYLGALTGTQTLMSARPTSVDYEYLSFQNGQLHWAVSRASNPAQSVRTAQVFRSPGWYDILIRKDLTASAGAARAVMEINGVAVTSFGAENYPDVSASYVNGTGLHSIGAWALPGEYLDGLMADVYMIDGAAVPMSAFGERNIHGVWVGKPKAEIHAAIASVGGFGPNGFHLDFSDPLTPGKDVSGRGNHFTASGFDATGKDTVTSTPGNVFATLNPLACGYGTGSTITLSDGNLAVAFGGINQSGVRTSIDPSLVNKPVRIDATLISLGVPGNTGLYVCGASYLANGVLSSGATVASYGAGDTITAEYDPVARIVRYYKNGALQGSCAAASKEAAVAGGNSSWRFNAGQRPWAYASPSLPGLCTDNLPEPNIKDPGEGFAQAATTGAGMDSALKTLTGHWGGAPYVEIVKRRDASEDWRVRFSDDPGNAWATNNALAKAAAPALAAGDYVGYRLRIGARYGVWTAEVEHVTGTVTTVTHGLKTARAAVIATRVSAGGGDRYVWHPDMTAGILGKLNRNTQPTADGTLTAFSATSFQIASTAPSGTYRVLVLAHRPGWLEIGSYKGNGSADGGFDAMGIAPLWQLIKRLDNSGAWMQSDTAHSPTNPMAKHFDMDKPDSEIYASYDLDMVVGGVKYRTNGYSSNDAGGIYLRIAIGRPIGGVCVAPATAR